ncbi:MAG: serine/threonine protein phosphatase [Oscillospiraceae bacterium]
MNILKRKRHTKPALSLQNNPIEAVQTVQTSRPNNHNFSLIDNYCPLVTPPYKLYDELREAVPIIDAAITKIIRLVGNFKMTCADKKSQELLDDFVENVNVSGVSRGLESFFCNYLDSLLMYGNAVGEIVFDKKMQNICGLYNAKLDDILIEKSKNPLETNIFLKNNDKLIPIKNREFVMFTALNPKPDEIYGNSLLKGLPFVSSVLLKIYQSISQNFERMGNLRYAVTYKPSSDGIDKAFAKERVMQIAKEWQNGMNATKAGQTTDFISFGDVSIKVIGADNQLMDTQIPVRQMLEQIVAKLGIPPFLLGLNWSSTERMSRQQTDILTSELAYYRRLIAPILVKICRMFLSTKGIYSNVCVDWEIINLQDEAENAKTQLYLAQAKKIESETLGGI